VIATKAGLRFIDADQVQQITRSHITCSIDGSQAASCHRRRERRSITSMRGRTRGKAFTTSLFRRPHWIRENDQT
jgi:hypothetical protein